MYVSYCFNSITNRNHDIFKELIKREIEKQLLGHINFVDIIKMSDTCYAGLKFNEQ